MKKIFLGIWICLCLAACTKTPAWKVAGTYSGTLNDSINPEQQAIVVITDLNERDIKIYIDPEAFFPEVTFQQCKATDGLSDQVIISESGVTGTYKNDKITFVYNADNFPIIFTGTKL